MIHLLSGHVIYLHLNVQHELYFNGIYSPEDHLKVPPDVLCCTHSRHHRHYQFFLSQVPICLCLQWHFYCMPPSQLVIWILLKSIQLNCESFIWPTNQCAHILYILVWLRLFYKWLESLCGGFFQFISIFCLRRGQINCVPFTTTFTQRSRVFLRICGSM